MAVTTIYKCDKCSHEQDNPDQMWNIGVSFAHLNYNEGYPTRYKEKLWCRPCMEKFDLLCGDKNPKATTPPLPVPTLEDIIRELVREEVTAMTGAC